MLTVAVTLTQWMQYAADADVITDGTKAASHAHLLSLRKDQRSSKKVYESLPTLVREAHKLLAEADPFPVTSATIVEALNRPPSKIWGTQSWPGDHVDFERHRQQVDFAESSAQNRALTLQQEAHPTGVPTDPRLSKKSCPSLLGAKPIMAALKTEGSRVMPPFPFTAPQGSEDTKYFDMTATNTALYNYLARSTIPDKALLIAMLAAGAEIY